jgi:hypothetical protein
MKAGLCFPFFLFFLVSSSCSKNEEFNFTLYAEYTDNVNNCKTIKVTIDDQTKLIDQVCYTGITPNVKISSFPIISGKHVVKAEIIGNTKVFNQRIEFDTSKKFGYLTFDNRTNEFSFFRSSTGGIMK